MNISKHLDNIESFLGKLNYKHGILIGCLLTLFLMNVPGCAGAQTYTFTQQSKATKVVLAAANNGSYTLTFNFTAGDSLHLTPMGYGLMTYGDNFVFVNFYNLVWVTTYKDVLGRTIEDQTRFHLNGWYGMNRIADKKKHLIVLMRSPTIKQVWVDGYLVGTLTTQQQNGFTADIWMGSDRADMKLCGTVSDVKFAPTFTVQRDVTPPTGVIDTVEYALNYIPNSQDYTNIPTAVQQYAIYPKPKYHLKSVMPRNGSSIELKYMSGYRTSTEPFMTENGKFLSEQLALYYNSKFRVCSSLNALYSDITRGYYSFDEVIMSVAARYPNIPKEFTTVMCHADNIAPYVAADLTTANNNTDISYFSGTRAITYTQGIVLKNTLQSFGISIDSLYHWEDNECMNGVTNTTQYNLYFNSMLDSMRSLFPHIYSNGYNIYSFWWQNEAMLFPQNLNIGNSPYSTESAYMETPDDWCNENGTEHGVFVLMKSKYDETLKGHPLSTYFVSPGWSMSAENNMQPGQWSGLLGVYSVMGNVSMFPAFFTTGDNVQEPKSYCYIPALVGLGQSGLSNPKFWKIITDGALVRPPDSNLVAWNYNWFVEDFENVTVVRKLGSEYLIACTRQKGNNFKYNGARKRYFNLPIENKSVPMYRRAQETVWYYNAAEAIVDGVNPKMITFNVPYKHLSRVESQEVLLDEKE